MINRLVIIIFLVSLSGCGYYNTFYNAKKYYDNKQYDEAKQKCEKILSKPSQRALHDNALFLLGNIYEVQEKYSEAIYCFEKLCNDFPNSSYADQAKQKIVESLIKRKNFTKAYSYIRKIWEQDTSEKNANLYSEVLFFMKYADEYKSFVASYPTDSYPGVKYWILYYTLIGKTADATALIKQLPDNDDRASVLNKVYFETLSEDIWKQFLSSTPDYVFLSVLYQEKIQLQDIDLFLERAGSLDISKKRQILKKLFARFMQEDNLINAKYTLIKLREMYNLDNVAASNFIELSYKTSEEKYLNLPTSIKNLFYNGIFYFILNDNNELFKLEKGRWTSMAMNNQPPTVSTESIVLWDTVNLRWIFIDKQTSGMQVPVLNFSNMQWDTILLDTNAIPQFSLNMVYLFENSYYIFYSYDSILKLSFEKDRIKAEYLDIGGIVPGLSGYNVFFLSQKGLFIIIGGNLNGIDNYMPYYLNISQPQLMWQECYVNKTIDWNSMISKQIINQNATLAFLWKTEQQTDSGNKELYKIYNISMANDILTLQEVANSISAPIELLDYQLLNHKLVPLVYYYRDSSNSFNNLHLIRMSLGINAKTTVVKKTASDVSFETNDDPVNYSKLINSLEQLNSAIKNPDGKYQKIAEILLYDLSLPEKALSYYHKALNEKPSAEICYAIAYINYQYVNNKSEAVKYFTLALTYQDISTVLKEKAEEYLLFLEKN